MSMHVASSRIPVSLHLVHCLFLCSVPAHTEIYTLSLHDALPISASSWVPPYLPPNPLLPRRCPGSDSVAPPRSEEHTSELQSRGHLVCRLLLEKKKDSIFARPAAHEERPARPQLGALFFA